MKIGILTFHYAYNYGALLQAWALKEFIASNGYDVEFVNHKNRNIAKYYSIFDCKYIKSNSLIKFLLKFLFFPVMIFIRIMRYRKLDRFIKNELPINPLYDDISKYDVLIVGSDQVWNYELTGGFDQFYWGIVKRSRPQFYFAYAASMNMLDISLKDKVCALLNNFTAISVRERILREQLNELTDREIKLVVDPTLLIDRKVWDKIVDANFHHGKNFVLAYPLREPETVIDIANKISDDSELGSTIIVRGESGYGFITGQKICTGVYEFITLIANADKIVTSSFHGTVLSIIFNKDFYAVRAKDKNNVRIESLLAELGLSDRLVDNYEDVKGLNSINYHDVNMKINVLRKDSGSYLLHNIEALRNYFQ